ncbi:hypothetical protein [Psychromonas sp. KJ10-2]|uniref:hypothetical protein n=1 Tax=Psychromonas sp. KJ10-2 TaxID=3391822 RepID=UPI0039B45718
MIVKIGKKLIDKASIIVDDVKSGIVEYSTTGFSSLKQLVTIESHDKAEDITHYFLIPNVHKAGTYILQTHRILPSVLSDNVIQRKVFHLPQKSR